MVNWLDILLGGIAVGALYVLVGHGFNIVYLTTRTFNFAQGQFVAMGGLLAYALIANGFPLAGIVGIILLVMALGVMEEKIAVTPILKSPDSEVWIVSTLGVSIFLQGLLAFFFGGEPLNVSLPYGDQIISFAGTRLTVGSYVVIAAAIVLTTALIGVLQFSWIGRALRAVAEDSRSAGAIGINTAALITGSFAVSAGLGALVGVLASPMTFARADLGATLLIQVFIALAIGGLVDGGASGGRDLSQIFEAFVKYYLGGASVAIMEFVILLIALILRPRGLFSGSAMRTV